MYSSMLFRTSVATRVGTLSLFAASKIINSPSARFSSPISTPRSPLAIIQYSAKERIELMFSTAAWVSILARIFALLFTSFFKCLRSS